MSVIVKPSADTTARQVAPNSNGATLARLYLDVGGSSDIRQAFIHFPRPFPAGAKVTQATLTVYLSGAWSGSHTITCKRITTKWGEAGLTYNNRPTVVATHDQTASVSGGSDKDAVTFDLTNMFNDVSAGGAYFGVQLTQSAHNLVALYGNKWGVATLRPTLELDWIETPNLPDQLSPDAGDSVSQDMPLLDWRFSDNGSTTQALSQVQILINPGSPPTTDADFASPDYDTGMVSNDQSSYDLNDGSFSGFSANDVFYWRVNVTDSNGSTSGYSDIAEGVYTTAATFAMTSPGSTVSTTEPTVEWSYSGRTQQKWRVTLTDTQPQLGAPGGTVLYMQHGTDSVTNAVGIPAGLIKSGRNYKMTLEVWDTEARIGDEHQTAVQAFTYVRDGTPNATTNLAAAAMTDADLGQTPAILVTFQRSTTPDYFSLRVDGVEVLDRVDPADAFTGVANHYQIIYWGAEAQVDHTIEVEAVELVTGKYVHSDGNPTTTVRTHPVGIWLSHVNTNGVGIGTYAAILGNDASSISFAVGESATTYDLISASKPVRITDSIRGYEGSIAGFLLTQGQRDKFLTLKGIDSDDLTLNIGDLSFPVRLEEISIMPQPDPGSENYAVSFNFFQSGPPWPVSQ